MDTSALYRAIEKRMWHDIAESKSVGNKAKRFRDHLFREAKNLPNEDSTDAVLTPLQQRIRDDINETTQGMEAIFAAFDRQFATENTEDDPASMAAIQLFGPLVGRIMALELRVAALEAALD